MILVALFLGWQAVAVLPPLLPSSASICLYDKAAMMALDERGFDQDMAGGWRTLSTLGCELAAADLIRDYRATHPSSLAFLSFWHEGQLRADVGQTARAIALFDRARKTNEEDHGFGWNLYVDGSIAFLRHDRAALQAARDKLAVLPIPAGLANMRGPDGKPRSIRWPMNLNVLDGLLRCFGKSYREAYIAPCSAPMIQITAPANNP